MIEVILLERVERLGQMGQVVKVRPGFARNFLLPHKKALRATKANLDLFDKQRVELEARNVAERKNAEALAVKLEGIKLVIIRQASEMGQLYGSVSARDVSDIAKEAGHDIQRMQVQIDSPIKTLGLFPIKVKLHPEVTIKVIVNVARSPEEAVVQNEKHAAASKASAEKAQVEAAFMGEKADTGAVSAPTDQSKPKPAKKAKAKAGDEQPAANDKTDAPPSKKKKAKE
jgi:large subunit ribosomal protein L9